MLLPADIVMDILVLFFTFHALPWGLRAVNTCTRTLCPVNVGVCICVCVICAGSRSVYAAYVCVCVCVPCPGRIDSETGCQTF